MRYEVRRVASGLWSPVREARRLGRSPSLEPQSIHFRSVLALAMVGREYMNNQPFINICNKRAGF